GNLGAIVRLRIIPGPTRAVGRPMKIAVITDEITRDALNAGICEGSHERFQGSVNVIIVQSCVDGRITTTEHNQIALKNSEAGFYNGVKRRLDSIIHAKAIQREGDSI